MTEGVWNITRLYYEAVKDIPSSLNDLDRLYRAATGSNLLELAARAAGVTLEEAVQKVRGCTAAVVPVTSGQGLIPGFSTAVGSILNHIGFTGVVTNETDIAGIGEAFRRKARLLFSADDRKFLAINLQTKKVVDNSRATAFGFVHALASATELNSTGMANAGVLVMGLGPVGTCAALELQRIGMDVLVFDIDYLKAEHFAALHHGIEAVQDPRRVSRELTHIFDATPAQEIIPHEMIKPLTVVSCPGVPHGLTAGALTKLGPRFIHDVLPLGVCVMALQAFFGSGD